MRYNRKEGLLKVLKPVKEHLKSVFSLKEENLAPDCRKDGEYDSLELEMPNVYEVGMHTRADGRLHRWGHHDTSG